MNKKILAIVSLFLAVSLISSASAGFTYYNNTIKNSYSAGSVVSGEITIKLENQSADSSITSNLGGSISLLDLLDENDLDEGSDYKCSTQGCKADYKEKTSVSSLSLNAGDKKIIGLKIRESGVEILSFKMGITSDAPQSCIRSNLIRLFDSEDLYLQNTKYTGSSCGYKYQGCFQSNLTAEQYNVAEVNSDGQFKNCERLTLPISPAYKVGAKIKNSTLGRYNLTMFLYDNEGELLGDCILPAHTQNEQELSCVIPHNSIAPAEYYACVESKGGNYMIRYEQSGQICGSGEPNPPAFNRDYEISAESMQFGTMNIDINQTSFDSIFQEDLAGYLNDYIDDKYNSNCSVGCYIPLEISGSLNQQISLNNIELKYRSISDGATTTTSTIYNLEKENATLSTEVLRLNIDPAGFKIPSSNSTQNRIEIFLNGERLFSPIILNLSSSGFDFDISPKFAFLGLSTEFTILSSANITSSKWEFGNAIAVNSNNKKAFYTFNSEGVYDVRVEAVRKDGAKSIRVFKITAGNANESAQLIIKRYETRIVNITKQINALPAWVKTQVEKEINVVQLNNSLAGIKGKLKVATNDEDYEEIVGDLLELNIPISVTSTAAGNLPIAVGSSNINSDYIESISNADSDKNEELKKAITAWMDSQYSGSISFETLSSLSDSGADSLVTKVKITASPKADLKDSAYLIIDYPIDEIIFMQAYSQKSVDSGTYIPLTNGANTIEFLIADDVEVADLGMYISPETSRLEGVSESVEPSEQGGFKTLGFWIWIIVLLIVTLAAYIALQEWYKKSYEKHLFKNPADLYNLINFIYNSRAAGLKDGDIRKKLSESGWKGEQVNYAFRKIDGKRTGMFEIPLFKFVENRRVRDELAKRQQKPIDARFIKRPNV